MNNPSQLVVYDFKNNDKRPTIIARIKGLKYTLVMKKPIAIPKYLDNTMQNQITSTAVEKRIANPAPLIPKGLIRIKQKNI